MNRIMRLEMPLIVRLSISLVVMLLLAITVFTASAHADLDRALPEPNSRLETSPESIRLWFTEPVEPAFSRITLYASDGSVVTMSAAVVSAEDAHELLTLPPALPNGIYTVVWRVVSSADGHSTSGSYPFSIGVALTPTNANSTSAEIGSVIPPEAAAIRWAHLLYLTIVVGGLGFFVIVWLPSDVRLQFDCDPSLRLLLIAAWLFLGVTMIAMLLLQTSINAGIPVLSALTDQALGQVLTGTRYGSLWIAQAIGWWVLGGLIIGRAVQRSRYWLAFAVSLGLALLQSMFSHSSAVENAPAAIAVDWLHLTGAALWFGGLISLIQVVVIARRHTVDVPLHLGRLIASFTNYARLSLAVILLSGAFVALLHVGSLAALLTTTYGQVLVFKILAILPLLIVAFINFRFTRHRLAAGEVIWTRRLQGLVGAEIAILVGVLAAVGMMTSIAPARTVLAARANAVISEFAPQESAFNETQTRDGLTITLTITPGTIGENTFAVALTDADGQPVQNATIIRMRFNHTTENLGESELNPAHQGNGVYSIEGANLSVPGTWRLRLSVARPQAFDVVTTFMIDLPASTNSQ